MPYVDEMTENLMIQIIARDVAKSVEMARSLGHQMPESYDVGVTFTRSTVGSCAVKPGATAYILIIRLNDAVVHSYVQLPDVNTDGGLKRTADLLEVAWGRIHQDAMTAAHAWIAMHPEAMTSDPDTALKRLAALEANEESMASWMRDCEEVSKRLQYKRQRGPLR